MRGLLIILTFINVSYAQAWPKYNNPFHFYNDLESNFNSLPNEGNLYKSFVAWPGNHWPSQFGGIAQRWSAGNPMHFSYHLNTLEELKGLEPHLLDELSPAEKFDIFNGRYDYPTVKNEWGRTNPNNISWFGICHGVAPASLHHPEPQTVTLTNKDGITLTFYSSDVKALISYYYAEIQKVNGKQIGRRCSSRDSSSMRRRDAKNCEDLNPGAFHLLLTNFLGKMNKTFIVDIDPWNEVWNHVPNGFHFDIYEEYPAFDYSTPGTDKVLWIGLTVSYAGAIAPYFRPVIGIEQGYYIDNNYQYELDLDKDGNIIGGKWISDLRPDFIWTRDKIEFKGYWQAINEIYLPREN